MTVKNDGCYSFLLLQTVGTLIPTVKPKTYSKASLPWSSSAISEGSNKMISDEAVGTD